MIAGSTTRSGHGRVGAASWRCRRSSRRRRRRVGGGPMRRAAFPHLTSRHMAGCASAAPRRRRAAVLALVGLDRGRRPVPHQLSAASTAGALAGKSRRAVARDDRRAFSSSMRAARGTRVAVSEALGPSGQRRGCDHDKAEARSMADGGVCGRRLVQLTDPARSPAAGTRRRDFVGGSGSNGHRGEGRTGVGALPFEGCVDASSSTVPSGLLRPEQLRLSAPVPRRRRPRVRASLTPRISVGGPRDGRT